MKPTNLLMAVLMLLVGGAFADTPTPIPTPFSDVALTLMVPGQTAVTLAVAQATKVIDPAVVGPYRVPLFKSDAYTSPSSTRFDYEEMNVVQWEPTPRILTVQRAQGGTRSATWKSGTYSIRIDNDLPTVTPTPTPVDTPTPVPTDTNTPTHTSTPLPKFTVVIADSTPVYVAVPGMLATNVLLITAIGSSAPASAVGVVGICAAGGCTIAANAPSTFAVAVH